MYPSRAIPLEAARSMLGLTVLDLWVDYFGLGGNLPPAAISAALSGRLELSDHDHDVLVQALNEAFVDRNENHPLSYADELPPPK
jgi:hypothetical protein